MFKKNDSPKIGDWVVTTKNHECLRGTMLKGSKVQIIDIDWMRGYAIQDEEGNRVTEIGWTI